MENETIASVARAALARTSATGTLFPGTRIPARRAGRSGGMFSGFAVAS